MPDPFKEPTEERASLVAQWGRILLPMQEMWVQSLSGEEPPEKEMAAASVLAWGNPLDRGAWWATGHGLTKSRTGLSDG